jgi:hypothetical protein
MCETSLYQELAEFREEQISLNDAQLKVINEGTHQFDIYAKEIKFVGGLHIDRQKNVKEIIAPYKNEYSANYTNTT